MTLSEPENRPDALQRTHIGVVADDHHIAPLGQGGLDGGLAHVLDLLERRAVGRAATAAGLLEHQQATGLTAGTSPVKAGLEQERLDAALVQRLERGLGSADAAPAAAHAGG